MTTPIYDIPLSKEIEAVEQTLLPRLTANSPFFPLMPFDSSPNTLLMWEQKDNYVGIQQWRGYGGNPSKVNRIGYNRYIASPGVYGEVIHLEEEELTKRRQMGTFGTKIGIADLVGEAHEQLLSRRLNLIEKIIADLLFNGSFSVAGPAGETVYQGSYTQRTYTPTTAWSDLANSTPLADMRSWYTFEAGFSVKFDSSATLICNKFTANILLNNANPADLGGKRLASGATLNDMDSVNRIMVLNDVPPVSIYNGGYLNEAGTWVYFIPNGKFLLIGKRPTGARVGFYRFTANVNSPNASAAPYVRTIWKEDVPSKVEVHDGHNGGPVIQFPSSIVKINAA